MSPISLPMIDFRVALNIFVAVRNFNSKIFAFLVEYRLLFISYLKEIDFEQMFCGFGGQIVI